MQEVYCWLVFDIVGEPAPTIFGKIRKIAKIIQIDIVCGVGRVYVNCWLVFDIVGEPAPTIFGKIRKIAKI
ncbi:hypothetical protein QUB70_09475, partial [Microcoleus sp. A003_D6]|uniref:hypothetical protein n=1 Tax=Microcoleus sp. A003_D6 TaxID=3055266 RepID=UPI002FCFC8B6